MKSPKSERMEAVLTQLTSHYWQSAAEVHHRLTGEGHTWSEGITRSALHALVSAGRVAQEPHFRSWTPERPTRRVVQMFRIRGDGADN